MLYVTQPVSIPANCRTEQVSITPEGRGLISGLAVFHIHHSIQQWRGTMKKLCIALAVVLLALPSFAFASPPAAATEMVASAPLNINQASAKELIKLPGIGKVTAERIIEFREANGPFVALEDLLKVNGVGKKTLAKIKNQISLD